MMDYISKAMDPSITMLKAKADFPGIFHDSVEYIL